MNWDEICQQRASNNHKTCSQPYRMNLYSLGCWFGCFSKLGLPFSTIGQIQMTCPLVMVPWNLPFKYFKKIVFLGCALWWFLSKTSGFSLSKFRTPNFPAIAEVYTAGAGVIFFYMAPPSNMKWVSLQIGYPKNPTCAESTCPAILLVVFHYITIVFLIPDQRHF